MSSEKSLTPQIRFKGFTEAWEQRKLGDYGLVQMCRRIYKDQTSEIGDVPFFKIGTFGSQPDAFISRSLFQDYRKQYPFPSVGTPLISAAGSIGRTVIYQGEEAYFQDSNIVWLDNNEKLNNVFLNSLYKKIDWKLEGSTIKRLYNKDILNAEVCVPSTLEQCQVGSFFAHLDSLITLHQRKLDAIKKIKSALLEKMFPKDGSDIPEIRFTGFTEAWEQRKLGDYLLLSTEKNTNLQYGIEDVLSVSWTAGVVNQIEFQGRSFAGSNLSGYDVAHHECVIYTKSPLKDEPFGIIKTNYLTSGIVSQLYAVYRTNSLGNPAFVETYFSQTARLNNYLRPLVNKGAKNTMNISDEEALKGGVIFPLLEEQDSISSLFLLIDRLITLHQREHF